MISYLLSCINKQMYQKCCSVLCSTLHFTMLLAAFTFLFIPDILGCGISTHTEIGYRAIQYLASASEDSSVKIRDILLRHQVQIFLSDCFIAICISPRMLSKLVTPSLTAFSTLFAMTGFTTTRVKTLTGVTTSRWPLIMSTANTLSRGLKRLKN